MPQAKTAIAPVEAIWNSDFIGCRFGVTIEVLVKLFRVNNPFVDEHFKLIVVHREERR
jgi:hypothetical protein